MGLTDEPIPVGRAVAWAERPHCGAVVLFTGTVRDHADGRPGVSELEYEAYEEEVCPRLAAIAADARRRWQETKDGQPVFGPKSPIATADACEAVGGRFRPRLFGWMAHVMAFSDGDPWNAHHH